MDRELGYSLHLRTTDLIDDFRRESENNFQYLQEILAEAKEHFARRESVHLLPKTPCAKTKRRRIIKDQASPSTPSSPAQLPSCNISPITADTTLNESTKPSTRSRKTKTSQPKRSSRPQRKQPRRGAKKASEVEDSNVDDSNISECKEGSPPSSPKRITRNKRKQSEKENEVPDENSKKKKKNVVIDDACRKVETPPNRVTRLSKKKESIDDENRYSTPSPQPKKVNHTALKTPPNAEVFIPETPQMQQQKEQISPADAIKAQVVRSSLKVVLTPKALPIEKNEQEVFAYADESTANNVVIVDAITYDNNQETQEKRKSKEQTDTPHSAKKLRQETRSSVKGTKRKQENNKELDKKARLLSPSATTSDEGYNTERNEDINVPHVSDGASTESTNQPKEQRRSFRPSRGSRRSSRQSAQRAINNIRKSTRIRQSQSSVKSSVLLTLSAKKLMPNLEKSQKDDNINQDAIKTKLFEEPKTTITTETDPEHSQKNYKRNIGEQLSNNEDSSPVEKSNSKKEAMLDSTDKHEENPSECLANDHHNEDSTCKDDKNDSQIDDKDGVDGATLMTTPTDNDEDDIDEFQDAQESSQDDDGDDDDHYHDASDKVDTNTDNQSLSRNSSTSSDSSNGSTEDQSTCKQHDNDCNRTQSSPEPSQENCIHSDDKKNDSDHDNLFGFENKVLKNNAGVVHSFIKRNTPKKVDKQEKTRQMKLAMIEKEEKEKERIQKLAELKQKKIEDQRRKREEKERKVAELRAAKTREQREKKAQLEKKQEMRKRLEDKAKKVREKEEEAKRKARLEKKAECDARRKQEEEQRIQKLKEKEEEEKKYREMLQRKAEFEEQERQRKILEAKRQQELREQELLREELEKQRALKEIEEKERKAKEKAERKMRDDKEKEEREQRRIAALFREKEEQERKEREKKAREEKLQKERELKFRLEEEAEKEKQRLRKLQEQRAAEEERLKQIMKVADNYVMTPPPPPKARAISTQNNYNIDDIGSDDSTDDEDAPKKIIPQWAQGAKLKAALISQSNATISDIEEIFGGVVMPNLDEIFTQKKRKRFYQRTSSAHWDSPPLKPLNRGTLI